MTSEMLRCPICDDGGKPYVQKYVNGRTPPDESYRVICRDCRSGVRRSRPKAEEAVSDWNEWPRWRRTSAAHVSNQERKRVDDRIFHQRQRLREMERVFGGKLQNSSHIMNKRLLEKMMEQAKEIGRLSALVREAQR